MSIDLKGVPLQYRLECKRCGNVYDARTTPPKQPCPNCEGELHYPADREKSR